MRRFVKWGFALGVLLLIVTCFAVFILVPPVWQMRSPIYEIKKSYGDQKGVFLMGPAVRGWTPSSEIPGYVKSMLITAEDWDFYSHNGVAWYALKEAFIKNWRSKRIVRGGSTLTQQLVKNFFLKSEQTYKRKAQDIIGALLLEKFLTKDEILTWYLNIVEFGEGVYGIRNAARHYFAKSPQNLSVHESIQLVLLLPNPRKLGKDLDQKNLSHRMQEKTIWLAWLGLQRNLLDRSQFAQVILTFPSGQEFVDGMIRDPRVVWRNPADDILNPRKRWHYGDKDSRGTSRQRNWKVAIDPGHFGGRYAALEGRELSFPGLQYQLPAREGELTLAIARELEKLLKNDGFEVMLTRRENGMGALNVDFARWAKQTYAKDISKLNISEQGSLFREYNQMDLRERLAAMSRYQADLAVSIHLNASGIRDDVSGEPVNFHGNYNIVFIPKEKFSKRLHKKLNKTNYEISEKAGKLIAMFFERVLRVELYNEPDFPKSERVSDGLYRRNIALTRLSRVPIVFGESLFLDNLEEARRLTDPLVTSDTQVNERLAEIARAYFYGIRSFFSEQTEMLAH